MPATAKSKIAYRCPLCLMNSRDPSLRYDAAKDEYYCQTCCFSARAPEIEAYYKVFKSKYKQLKQKIRLKRI